MPKAKLTAAASQNPDRERLLRELALRDDLLTALWLGSEFAAREVSQAVAYLRGLAPGEWPGEVARLELVAATLRARVESQRRRLEAP